MKYHLITDNAKLKLPVPGYNIMGLSLSPHMESGYNTCKMATTCVIFCVLKFVGHQNGPDVRKAAIRRTKLFYENFDLFSSLLCDDLEKWIDQCYENQVQPLFRPNTASDEEFGWIAELYPELRLYDYTKVIERLESTRENYHITYSWNMRSHRYEKEIKQHLARGGNVAVITDTPYWKQSNRPVVGAAPSHIRLFGEWRPLVDMDQHDARIPEFDGAGQIGILRFKGGRKSGVSKQKFERALRVGDVLRQDDASMFKFENAAINTNLLEVA